MADKDFPWTLRGTEPGKRLPPLSDRSAPARLFLPGLLSPEFGGAVEVATDVDSARRVDDAAGPGLVLPL